MRWPWTKKTTPGPPPADEEEERPKVVVQESKKKQLRTQLRSEASALLEATRSARALHNEESRHSIVSAAEKAERQRTRWKRLCCRKRKDEAKTEMKYQVDETGPPFDSALMDRRAYQQLQLFSRKHGVTQKDLQLLWSQYQDEFESKSHPDGSRKPSLKLSMLYFQDLYDRTSTEAVSLVMVPLLFVKDAHGLPKPMNPNEIDFVRFVIAGYHFGAASPAGLVIIFFRLLLDYAACSSNAMIPLRPFEELVGLLHGGLNRPLLALMLEAFEDLSAVRFGDLVRSCVAMPLLLWPLFQFQRSFRRKFLGNEFWYHHALPCFDPFPEATFFDDLAIHPRFEIAIDDVFLDAPTGDTERCWRLIRRRLLADILAQTPEQRQPPRPKNKERRKKKKKKNRKEKAKKNCWRDLTVQDDAVLTATDLATVRTRLRDRHGDRVASFFLALSDDLTVGSLRNALATDARLGVLDDVLKSKDLPTLLTDFRPIEDPASRRTFYHNAATGLSTWSNPNADFLIRQNSLRKPSSESVPTFHDDDDSDEAETPKPQTTAKLSKAEQRRRKIKYQHRRRHSKARKQ